MHVRFLIEADSEAYRLLRTASIDESPEASSLETVRELANYMRIGTGVLTRYAIEGSPVWGAFDGDRLVGAVAGTREFEQSCPNVVRLWGLYVQPEYRGTGAGVGLMQTAMAWIRQQPDITVVELRVGKCNQSATN